MKPGLYAIGSPSENDNLIVTCNYKLTFDIVRNSLEGINIWLLLLDTDGVNVWCAAGKGSFGSAELIYSLEKFNVERHINHKNIIVPQLGAPGIQSHLVKEITGFTIKYGPIHIKDLKNYINNGYKTDENIRKVTFNLFDRLKVSTLELVIGMKYFLIAMISLLILTFIIPSFNLSRSLKLINHYFLTLITATILFPALLPYLPFRMFYKRAFILGVLFNIIFLVSYNSCSLFSIGNSIISVVLISYIGLNFTGSSTFTSLSGVKKEMNEAVPILSILGILSIFVIVIALLLEVF
ncbi:mercury methylation corrinoid protein HgcA [Helicovermis profundi]|uniref:Mercury methylation corrinoid protein HgcA n=1 Tax=Helicovermis profundi TaxID=3065157 RepID=A0AAU9EN26_9FIRM|nr:mercury methylation corrinoid protein HgcA [Clostridia bacterium S502]